jgi:hypothetical protein
LFACGDTALRSAFDLDHEHVAGQGGRIDAGYAGGLPPVAAHRRRLDVGFAAAAQSDVDRLVDTGSGYCSQSAQPRR